MPKTSLNLGTGSDPGIHTEASGVRHVNCYVHQLPEGKYQNVIYPIPGLKRWDDSTLTGETRALIKLDENTLVGVIGNRVIEYKANGAATARASLAGSGRVYAALNMKTTRQICFVTSDNEAFIYEDGVVTQITDSDLDIPTSVTWLDGYFLFSHDTGTFSFTNINDGFTVDATDIATAESKPDTLVRIISFRGMLAALGSESSEFWQNRGGNTPFVPVQADIPVGCMSGHTAQEVKDGLVFVSHVGQVVITQGSIPSVISNQTVEHKINQLTDSDKGLLVADVFWHEGYEIYCLQSPGNWTYAFNIKNGTWFEMKSYAQDDHRATFSCFFNNKYLIGDRTNGKVYHIDRDTDDEDGNHLIMDVYPPVVHGGGERIRVNALHVQTLKGQGKNTTNTHNSDPQLMISYSDDGGRNFTAERRVSMGQDAEYQKITRFNRLGMIKPNGRHYKISMSAAVKRGLLHVDQVTY